MQKCCSKGKAVSREEPSETAKCTVNCRGRDTRVLDNQGQSAQSGFLVVCT